MLCILVHNLNKDSSATHGEELERNKNNWCNPTQHVCQQSASDSKRGRHTRLETWTHMRRIRTLNKIFKLKKTLT